MVLYKVDSSDATIKNQVSEGLNLKQIKLPLFNIELRDIYWHLALSDYFEIGSPEAPKKYSNNFIEFFFNIIGLKEYEDHEDLK